MLKFVSKHLTVRSQPPQCVNVWHLLHQEAGAAVGGLCGTVAAEAPTTLPLLLPAPTPVLCPVC